MHVWSARYPVFQAMGELLNRIASAAEDVEIVNDEPGDFSLDPNVLLLGRGGTSGVPVTGCTRDGKLKMSSKMYCIHSLLSIHCKLFSVNGLQPASVLMQRYIYIPTIRTILELRHQARPQSL